MKKSPDARQGIYISGALDAISLAETAMTSAGNAELKSIHSILWAANFAAVKHAAQKRKGAAAEPYINHLIEVAHLVSLALTEPDTNLIIAALLHDVIEDCGVTQDELTKQLGSDVADLVMEVTDDKSLPKAERKRFQVVNASKISARAQIIKLADKISNVRALLSSPPADWSLERQREYLEWARQVVNNLSVANPVLKAEFDAIYSKFNSESHDS
jgi:GTP diphosphokinase / guanosine-3',5'-bis(diphosphate) 3'-diphosphatase